MDNWRGRLPVVAFPHSQPPLTPHEQAHSKTSHVLGLLPRARIARSCRGRRARTSRCCAPGAATSNITPPIGPHQAVRSSRPQATHVHDELHARCLVLDDGQAKLALVVCDLRHMSAEVAAERQADHPADDRHPAGVRASSRRPTRTPRRAPRLEEREGQPYYDYGAFLTRRIADGVVRAVNQLEPARIGWGVVEEPTQVFNRRWFLKPERGPIYGAHDNIEQVDTNPGYSGLLEARRPRRSADHLPLGAVHLGQADLAAGLLRAALRRRGSGWGDLGRLFRGLRRSRGRIARRRPAGSAVRRHHGQRHQRRREQPRALLR